MSEPRKHHYLPQFYLREFSLDGRGIFQINKRTGRFYGAQIKDTAAIRDFHEIDGDDVEDPQALEKKLAQVEGALAQGLGPLASEGLTNAEARSAAIQFLALMRLRVPAVKAHIVKHLEATVRATAKILERQGNFPKPPDGLEKLLKVDSLQISIANWKCLEQMFRMAVEPDVLAILKGMRGTLYKAPFGTSFITSDQPVAFFHSGEGLPFGYGVGPITPGVEITLPMSSRLLLHLENTKLSDTEVLATTDQVNEFNRRTIVMADTYIFASQAPEKVASALAPLASTFAGFRHESIEAGGGFLQLNRCLPVLPSAVAHNT